MRKTVIILAATLGLSAGCDAPSMAQLSQSHADVIFLNGKIYTVNDEQPWAEALALSGRDILFVGTNNEVSQYRGDDTEVVDLGEKLMLPGMIDTHMHPMQAGKINSVSLDLYPHMGKSEEEVMQIIRDHAETLGPDEWLLGDGISYDYIANATRQKLDELSGGRPAMISSFAHNGWFNTRALEILGVTAETEDPEGGTIAREADGRTPSGYMTEDAAFGYGHLVEQMAFNADQRDQILKTAIALANEQGITSFLDAHSATKADDDVYKRVYAKGEMNARVNVAMGHGLGNDDRDNLDDLTERAMEGDGYLDISTVKINVDGTPGLTAAMFEPYLDGSHPPLLYPQDRLNQVVDELTEAGLRMYAHTEGDLASYAMILALQHANETGAPLSLNDRHALTHVDHLRLEDIPRMKALNILASIQPHWAASNDYAIQVVYPNVKKEVVDIMFPHQEMLDAGLHVSIGADWPTSPEWTPWELIQVGMTRTQTDGRGGKFPGKTQSLEDMLRCFTIEGAYLMFLENVTGSLEAGKRADLIVLDQNLFETSPNDIHKTKVLLTMFDGKVVWGNIQQLAN